SQMAYETVEQFRILFLDKKNRLIADEVQQVGTVDHTPVYPREVIRRSLELSATALILVHNHPSGDPAPSSADVRMTREIAEIAEPLVIVLLDHIIVGKAGHASLRGLTLIGAFAAQPVAELLQGAQALLPPGAGLGPYAHLLEAAMGRDHHGPQR